MLVKIFYLLILLCAVGGCVDADGVARGLGEPIEALCVDDGAELTSLAQWLRDCNEGDGKTGVRELVLRYLTSGRDFAGAQGPDGYVICVTPLDIKWRVRQIGNKMTVGLFNSEKEDEITESNALFLWQLKSDRLRRYWTTTSLLDGYVLRLSWGDYDPGTGSYLLVVMLEVGSGGKAASICQKIEFEDVLLREQEEDTRQ